MSSWYEQAAKKLAKEKNVGSYDSYATAMKKAVCEALDTFCRQDEEFAEAVAQGGSFADCMKAVAKNCGRSLSDLEAYRRAAAFYFPGADVSFQMSVRLAPHADEEADTLAGRAVILNLEDFL
jgi:hypothetical protein